MFSTSRDEVRDFFIQTWRKQGERAPLTPLEGMALDIIFMHPEYQSMLASAKGTTQDEFTLEQGGTNPFLHMSLHLAIEEQLSIDQPAGLRREFDRLMAKFSDRHQAAHAVLECLGETVWRSQRENLPPDAEAYLECVKKVSRGLSTPK